MEGKKLVIIGASGHGKVVADIAAKNGYKDIAFLDDNENICNCGKYPVIGKCSSAEKIDCDIVIGIGNAVIRERLQNLLDKKNIITLIHPNAVVAEDVSIGKGTVVMAGAVINSGAIIGKGCIINTCSSVDHDCQLGNFVHVAVGSHLCGTVKVGNETWIGAGATVSNNVSICNACTVGAGAVVIKDIFKQGIYVGIPAKMIKPK